MRREMQWIYNGRKAIRRSETSQRFLEKKTVDEKGCGDESMFFMNIDKVQRDGMWEDVQVLGEAFECM